MAGSADITGKQNYVMGIGHPKSTPSAESPPVTVVTNPLTGGMDALQGTNGIVDVFNPANTAIIFGHSIVEENYLFSTYAVRKVARWWTYAEAFLGQRLTLLNNAGVSGQTLAQMEARIDNGTYGVGFGPQVIPATNESIEVRFPSQHTQVNAGDVFSTVCETTVQGAGGANLAYTDNAVTPNMYMQFNDGANNHIRDSMQFTSTDAALKDSHTLVLKTPDFVALPATTYTTARPVFSVNSKGAGTIRVKLGRVGFMKKVTS